MREQVDAAERSKLPARNTHRIPDLQFDLSIVNRDHPRAELHADGQVMDRLEALVCELQQQARLADTCANGRWSS